MKYGCFLPPILTKSIVYGCLWPGQSSGTNGMRYGRFSADWGWMVAHWVKSWGFSLWDPKGWSNVGKTGELPSLFRNFPWGIIGIVICHRFFEIFPWEFSMFSQPWGRLHWTKQPGPSGVESSQRHSEPTTRWLGGCSAAPTFPALFFDQLGISSGNLT